MAGTKRPSRRGIAGYIRESLEARLGQPGPGGHWTQARLAESLGVTKGQVWQVLHPERTGSGGVGQTTIFGFLDLEGISQDELSSRALAWEREHPEAGAPEPRVVKEERYPNRAVAVAFARASGTSEEAIKGVEQQALFGPDLTPDDWLARIRARDSELRTAGLRFSKAEKRVPIKDEDDEPPKEPIRRAKPRGK